jgi:hypothetical protein
MDIKLNLFILLNLTIMKKNLIILLTLAFTASIIIISCNKEEKQIKNEPILKYTAADFADIGNTHNALLQYVFDHNTVFPVSDQTIRSNFYTYLTTSTTYDMTDFDDNFDRAISSFNSIIVNGEISTSAMISTLRNVERNTTLTSVFTDQVEDIITDLPNLTREDVIDRINNISTTGFSTDDVLYYGVFVDVATHSYDFWKSHSSSRGWGKDQWAIFNDALGGVFGTALLPPYGGFALGAYWSISTYNYEIDD